MSTSFHRRGFVRALLTGGAVTAVALLPATAWAADDPLPEPVGELGVVVEDVVGGAEDQEPAAATGTETPPDPAEELQKLIDDFRAQFPENECVDGVAAALEDLLALIADPEAFEEYRAAFEAYVAEVQDLLANPDLTELPTLPEPPSPPEGFDPAEFEEAVQNLVAALEACQPVEEPPPSEEPEEPVTPGYTPPADTGAPPPGSYPGYAPTGAQSATESGAGPAPLLGGALLLVGAAGVAGSRMRTRAARGAG